MLFKSLQSIQFKSTNQINSKVNGIQMTNGLQSNNQVALLNTHCCVDLCPLLTLDFLTSKEISLKMNDVVQLQKQLYSIVSSVKISIDNELKVKRCHLGLENVNMQPNQQGLLLEMMKLEETYNLLSSTMVNKELNEKIKNSNSKNEQISSLEYQKVYLQSEIEKLKNKSTFNIDDPSLGLIPFQEFKNQYSLSEQTIYQSLPVEKQIIQRLEWEYYKREMKLKELKSIKDQIIETKLKNEKTNRTLKNFEDKIRNNIDMQQIIKPLQSNINIQSTEDSSELANHQIHPLLYESPLPLYTLFCEIKNFKSFFYRDLLVDIISTPHHQQDSSTSSSLPNSTVGVTNLKPSTISIIFSLINSQQSKLVIQFFYYPTLKIITVLPTIDQDSDRAHQFLTERFDRNDNGFMTPNTSNHYLFDSKPFNLKDYQLLGRPYKWAQFICGLSFLPEIPLDQLNNPQYQIHNFKPKTSFQIFSDILTSFTGHHI
ncbi:hypothetical protein DLAC_01938 [Tieghemostelium lacteum]|uniref:Uncharacterized protein n=1 Tax=Tieghemostelium lacteum TaxID=361077 RepID=A0A152A540_TIELA|nr:hypothetical protein DLAC_01938 [Tieghemostelium lacteum]|eukprot:KYR01350.1 hypothetical protein DLAC_01938 [Tieghemostelium lacteum]